MNLFKRFMRSKYITPSIEELYKNPVEKVAWELKEKE